MSGSARATEAGRRRGGKSAAAFRTISEVSDAIDVPAHVLRFWETKFTSIRPLKRGGGRRYYRPEDVELLRGIRDLLYSDGYTIKGVQKLLRAHGGKLPANAEPTGGESPKEVEPKSERSAPLPQLELDLSPKERKQIGEILAELKDLRAALQAAAGASSGGQ